MKKKTTRYSEAFKRQVVNDLETGKFSSFQAASRAYSIGGSVTVRSWVLKYGSAAIHPKVVKVSTMKEQDELKKARGRIRELEAALSDAHIDCCLETAYLEIACDRMGEEPWAFKKKNAVTLSGLRRKQRGSR